MKWQTLKKQIQFSESKIENMESNIENQAQYSGQNCLIILRQPVKVDGNEDTDQIAINILNEKLKVNVTKSDLNRSHRLRTSAGKNAIIVKFFEL